MERRNPQVENGYTKIANELLEVVVATPLPSRHKDLWWFVIRKTYGYNKKQDKISLSQFVKGTGIDRSGVCRIIKDLVAWRLLGKKGSISAIIKDYSQWIPQKRKLSSGVQDNRVVAQQPHTKESITKESITGSLKSSPVPYKKIDTNKIMWKDTPETFGEGAGLEPLGDLETPETTKNKQRIADTDRVIAAYDKIFAKEYRNDPKCIETILIPRKRNQIKYALKMYSADQLVKYLPYYFLDKRYDDQYHPLMTFLSTITLNKLKIAYEKDN